VIPLPHPTNEVDVRLFIDVWFGVECWLVSFNRLNFYRVVVWTDEEVSSSTLPQSWHLCKHQLFYFSFSTVFIGRHHHLKTRRMSHKALLVFLLWILWGEGHHYLAHTTHGSCSSSLYPVSPHGSISLHLAYTGSMLPVFIRRLPVTGRPCPFAIRQM